MKIGEIGSPSIAFDIHSRDEIPKLLRGLQSIYTDWEAREEVFDVLKGIVPENVDPNRGRKGMDLWKILVLGTLRLECNWDYDKLLEMANARIPIKRLKETASSLPPTSHISNLWKH